MIQKENKANHQGDDTNPPGGMGCGRLEIPLAFLLLIIILQVKMVVAFGPYRYGSKGLQVLGMKKERRRLFREAFDGLNLQFSRGTSPCPVNKRQKLATYPAPNVLNIIVTYIGDISPTSRYITSQ